MDRDCYDCIFESLELISHEVAKRMEKFRASGQIQDAARIISRVESLADFVFLRFPEPPEKKRRPTKSAAAKSKPRKKATRAS